MNDCGVPGKERMKKFSFLSAIVPCKQEDMDKYLPVVKFDKDGKCANAKELIDGGVEKPFSIKNRRLFYVIVNREDKFPCTHWVYEDSPESNKYFPPGKLAWGKMFFEISYEDKMYFFNGIENVTNVEESNKHYGNLYIK